MKSFVIEIRRIHLRVNMIKYLAFRERRAFFLLTHFSELSHLFPIIIHEDFESLYVIFIIIIYSSCEEKLV